MRAGSPGGATPGALRWPARVGRVAVTAYAQLSQTRKSFAPRGCLAFRNSTSTDRLVSLRSARLEEGQKRCQYETNAGPWKNVAGWRVHLHRAVRNTFVTPISWCAATASCKRLQTRLVAHHSTFVSPKRAVFLHLCLTAAAGGRNLRAAHSHGHPQRERASAEWGSPSRMDIGA